MTTPWVADYTSRIAPDALKVAGVVGVCRYLSPVQPNTDFKRITATEYRELTDAGIEVLLNWEYDARDWLEGASAGATHAWLAISQARALGHPEGRPIVGSVDFDITLGQWNIAGAAYATAFRDAVTAAGYLPGVYGPWDALTWCQNLGFQVFWQAGMSSAWSGGRNGTAWPGAHLRQRREVTVANSVTDWNDILRPDWNGQKTSMGKLFVVDGHTWHYWSPDGSRRIYIKDMVQFTNWVKNHGWPLVDNIDAPIVVSPDDLYTLAGPCEAGPDPVSTGNENDIRTVFASTLTVTADQMTQLVATLGPAVHAELAKLGITLTLQS